jgi:phosphogluconate dehydratase
MALNPRLAAITRRIIERSGPTRTRYLERIAAAVSLTPRRAALGCANQAHGFAACGSSDKALLRLGHAGNLAIVTSYNDMLSAHQPYERFPEIIRQTVRAAGGVAQVAGGVPAMCDGITQGETGMELSLFSRDVIALSTAVALSHQTFDAAVYLGICDKIVPRPAHRRALLRAPAGGLYPQRPHALGLLQRRPQDASPALCRGSGHPR